MKSLKLRIKNNLKDPLKFKTFGYQKKTNFSSHNKLRNFITFLNHFSPNETSNKIFKPTEVIKHKGHKYEQKKL